MKFKFVKSYNKFIIIVLFAFFANSTAQPLRKNRVDTFRIALKTELKKHLYPQVDSLISHELAVFVVFPYAEPNSSLRLIEKNEKYYLEVRLVQKNVNAEVIRAFANHRYTPLTLPTDSFCVQVSEKFKNSMLVVFRKTVHEKFTDLFPKQIQIYDGTNYNFWINENAKTTSKTICEDGDAMYFGWKVAKINLQLIMDVKTSLFDETKYDQYK
jgi:hypothetical protein